MTPCGPDETMDECLARNRQRYANRLRKLMALYNDSASPEGERAAVLAAIERIREVLPAREFDRAKAEASAPEVESFAARMRARRSRHAYSWQDDVNATMNAARERARAFEEAQEQDRVRKAEAEAQRLRRWADEKVREWTRNRVSNPTPSWVDTNSRAMSEAYPDAYGSRKP